MPPVPVGQNQLTALSRRYLIPFIADIVYPSNPILHRLSRGRRETISGGYQMEMPVLYAKTTTPKNFRGWEPLDVAEQDNIRNAAWDMKQVGDTVAINKLTLHKQGGPDNVFSYLRAQFEQGVMGLQDKLGFDLQTDGTDNKKIWGLEGAVDDGSVLPTYAGLARATYTGWASYVDDTSATISPQVLLDAFIGTKRGGRTASLIYSNAIQWGRWLSGGFASQTHPVGASGHDDQLWSVGHTNTLFMNIPWVEDDHTFDGASASDSAIVMLNESYINLGVRSGPDFTMSPFESLTASGQPQIGWVSSVDWMGELLVKHPGVQGKLTNITA